MRVTKIFYIILVFVLLLTPSAGLLFAGPSQSTSAEKRELADFPSLTADDTLNTAYLSEAGDWFEEHFAGRTAFVTANSLLKQCTLGSVYGDEVLIGKNGYLFYDGTLDDYFRRHRMTERELFITAYNIRLLQDYCSERGAQFLFALAANKNTLYPQYMPDHYLEGNGKSNARALLPYLDALGVEYVNMADILAGRDDLYYKKDSHWTPEGAYLGYQALMTGLDKEKFLPGAPVWKMQGHVGDIEEMLLPEGFSSETAPALTWDFHYSADAGADAPNVRTKNPDGTGTLMMYRDSFGEGLLPYLAETFSSCWFTQIWPCVMNDIDEINAQYVILEKVERNLIDLAVRPAIMRPPAADPGEGAVCMSSSQAELRDEGSLVQVHGSIEPALLETDTPIYIAVGSGSSRIVYRAFLSTNSARQGNDCYIYISKNQLEHSGTPVQLIIGGPDGPLTVYEERLVLQTSGQTSANTTQEDI